MALTNRETGSIKNRIRSVLLRKGELVFQNLLEKLPAGAYTCNPQGLITYYNPHAIHIWGRIPRLNHASEKFCGSFRLYTTEGHPILHDECWMALALKTKQEYNQREIVIERPNGDRVTVLAHANPIYDDRGILVGGVNVLVDITDRKRVEDSLKEADKAKNQFLAVLAHELRNPLAPVSNALELLRLKVPPSEEVEHLVRVIDHQMKQMTRLIDDLLDIARVNANKLELRRAPVSIEDIIRAAMEISDPVIQDRGVKFATRLPQDPVYVDGDLTRLAQVLSNLLNNATKYTDREGKIWLTVEPRDGRVFITVRDTGIGIPSDVLPRVFEMFTQAQQAIDRSTGGLGIGLTLVKQIVEMHGGSVSALSEGPGKGSEFTFSLPVIEAPVKKYNKEEIKDNTQALDLPFRILVVEDNLITADMLSMMLQMRGCEVHTANDGLEGLKSAEQFKPDIVLLDIGLPSMDGFAMAHAIRTQSWGADIVLIAITGWGDEQQKLRCAEVGIDYHLVKPVHPSELLNLLRSIEGKKVLH
jgi:PAS domain S-box-containing protein